MSTRSRSIPPQRKLRERMLAFCLSLLSVLLALPATAAIDIPTDPLTTGARVPPNILFILDDSGSMAFDAMPDSSIGTEWDNRSYVHNAVYYNPATNYQPWIAANGSPMTGGTSYGAVYGDFNLASGGTIDLADSSSCRSYNKNNNATSGEMLVGGTQVCGGVQTFYVPKDRANTNAAYLADQANFYRYQILADGRVIRSEWLTYSAGSSPSSSYTETLGNSGTGSISSNSYRPALTAWSFTVPANARNLVITSSGGSVSGTNRGADLFVRYNNATVTTGSYTHRSQNNGNAEEISVPSPSAGTWYARLYAQTAFTGAVTVSMSYETVDGALGCATTFSGSGWRNCQATTPTGRSAADERQNFATWFSYHRTRMKSAKAGASEAFSELGSDVRVGYRTIWQRNGATVTGNWPRQAVPIPVQYNNGLFSDVVDGSNTYDNRTKWYTRLQSTIGYNGTPLRSALQSAGDYFSSSASDGPYGPQSGVGQLACRQNFTILTTDGYWNSDDNFNIGNTDNASGVTITHGTTGSTYQYSASAPYRDNFSNTLADVAMYYWKTDLRAGTSGLSNIVPTTTKNPAFWQHMVTFGISIGLSGNTGFTSVDDVPANYSQWPDPTNAEDADRIDDLLHAAVNSRGTFLSASNPSEFSTGLKAALSTIVERTGSFSNVAANSTSLDTGTRIFQANYVSSVWSGELASYPFVERVVSTSPRVVENVIAGEPSWRASTGIPATGRKVITYNGTVGRLFPSQATTTQLAALTRISSPAVTGVNNAAYIAGARNLEMSQTGGTLRNRNSLLGDIVSSSPAYVEDTGTVYVGANDGMLHAVNATNGRELFAYIPNIVNWGALETLSRPDYSHRYFVDGPVVVSTRKQTTDRNILVGTLGKGGKGLYALDVTNPATFGVDNVLWERNETPGGNMGLVQGEPIIAKLPTATGGTFNALIVGNGVNSTNNRSVLLVYDLVSGDLVREISTGAGSATSPNGLSAPVGWDANGDGVVEYIYAGDTLGNVWKFNTAGAPSSWAVANSGNPMFVATDSAGIRQPISGRLTVALHPSNFTTWVFFGTGRFVTTDDVANRTTQGLYGIRDDGVVVQRSSLIQRQTVVAGNFSSRPVRSFQGHAPLPLRTTANELVRGWYIDLLEPPNQSAIGERIVTEAQVINRVLVAASIIPTADACQSDGRGYINALDAFTGTSLSEGYFDVDGDGSFTNDKLTSGDESLLIGSVDLGVGMPTLPNLLRDLAVAGGSSGGRGQIRTRDNRTSGRVSWREVVVE
ncbi:PilC/PilY family type IV pilus protein [Luteimonas sp. RIT-PG2_3]